jgi:hypothetical protein
MVTLGQRRKMRVIAFQIMDFLRSVREFFVKLMWGMRHALSSLH